jgi:acetolactate synthase regulatory subunit
LGILIREHEMNAEHSFFAQDQAGTLQRVHVVRHSGSRAGAMHGSSDASAKRIAAYALDDGRPLRRIDSDTFQILDTGALVTLVRD